MMCFRNITDGKKSQIKKRFLRLCSSYQKQQHIQQSMVKQTSKKAKLKINDTEKENLEKKKEKSTETDNQENHSDISVIEDGSEIDERDVGF